MHSVGTVHSPWEGCPALRPCSPSLNEGREGRLPDRLLTDPGVRYPRTGLFETARFSMSNGVTTKSVAEVPNAL
jgi:hypothetical protein